MDYKFGERLDAIAKEMFAVLDDPSRSGLHFEAFVELIYLRALYVAPHDPDGHFAMHEEIGRPFPDSGHEFWKTPEDMEPEDAAQWQAEMQKWKDGLAELAAMGLTPRLD